MVGATVCGPGDTLTFAYNSPTNQPALSSQNVIDIFDLQTKFPYFTSYNVSWFSANTVTLTVVTVNTSLPYPDFVNAQITQVSGTNFGPRTTDGTSKEATGTYALTGICGKYRKICFHGMTSAMYAYDL